MLEESLRRRAIPYRLVGAVRFYDRREIKDLLAWLRLIANPADDEAFRRAITAPRRGIGDDDGRDARRRGRGRRRPAARSRAPRGPRRPVRASPRGTRSRISPRWSSASA